MQLVWESVGEAEKESQECQRSGADGGELVEGAEFDGDEVDEVSEA